MNAYLFNALVSHSDKGHFVDACWNIILYGGDEAASWKAFEGMLLSSNRGENPGGTKIQKMVGAPVLEQLLTEAGSSPINWPQIPEEVQRILESIPLDDQEQGYWVDCEQWVRADKLAPGIDWLKRELPEEIRCGLNWSLDKTYFFLITVLSPPPASAELTEESNERPQPAEGQFDEDDFDTSAEQDSYQQQVAFPQLMDKELAVVARARNSVVAAWLWRKYAAGTSLAANAIRIDALCDIVRIGGEQ